MDTAPTFARDFIRKLQLSSRTATTAEPELPHYNVADAADVDLLVSSSTPVQVQLGTGADIYASTLIPAILAAQSEVILVTCFWAKSDTLSALSDALDRLASHRRSLIDRGDYVQTLHMHICFSSRSLLQKLFHTSSRHGYTYPSSSWPKVLGLPAAQVLHAGRIELQVKTLFFLPFSVMHPKFLIIDRQRAFIPSCNVSWEAWLEGCVEISGPVIVGLLNFFARTWSVDLGFPQPLQEPGLTSIHHCERFSSPASPILTVLLPSSHHRNPNFRPFPWQAAASPPPTPLNVALLHLINNSRRSIYVQTPNLTCAAVISALLDALSRGVDVNIVTNRNMMLVEQLLTSGTTTAWCLRSLLRRYSVDFDSDLEAQLPLPGHLRVSYFQPRQANKSSMTERRHGLLEAPEEPVHSHLKLTVVDGEHTVLGSGNMDRASWYTSQELGILFQSRDFAVAMMATVSQALEGRLNAVFENP
ncbi:phospholipase D/nuclease [Coniochaeta sp. PMI_546]|nr:phospholipase D/nuclease [Coniochaeta sp. PMI_546]